MGTPNARAICHRVTTVGFLWPNSRPLTYARSTPILSARAAWVRPAAIRSLRTFRPTIRRTSSDMAPVGQAVQLIATHYIARIAHGQEASLGNIEIYAGDFKPGKLSQLGWVRRGIFAREEMLIMDVGSRAREKIPLSQIAEIEKASAESVNRLGGAIGWGIAGDALFGPVGLLAGLVAGSRGTNVDFVCKLADDRKFIATAPAKTFSKLRAAAALNQWNARTHAHSIGPVEKGSVVGVGKESQAVAVAKNKTVICRGCGRKNSPTAQICGYCRAKLNQSNAGSSIGNGRDIARASIGPIIAWAYAIFVGIGGISLAVEGEFLPGLFAVASAIVALPMSSAFVQHRFDVTVPSWLRIGGVFALIFAMGATVPTVPQSHESATEIPAATPEWASAPAVPSEPPAATKTNIKDTLNTCLLSEAKEGEYSSLDGGKSAVRLLGECDDQWHAYVGACMKSGQTDGKCTLSAAVLAQAALKLAGK